MIAGKASFVVIKEDHGVISLSRVWGIGGIQEAVSRNAAWIAVNEASGDDRQ